MNNTKENEQIDIKRLLEVILDRIVTIVVITLVFGLVFFAVSQYFIVPKYESTTTLYVNNQNELGNAELDSKMLSSDITASRQLVPTYIEMIQSKRILKEVSNVIEEKTHQEYSVREIKEMLSVEAVADTEIIRIAVRNEDPAIARDIANAIAEESKKNIPEIISQSTVSIIDKAESTNSPVFPNVRNSIILGALLGFILSISVISLKEIFDVRVKSADDLVGRFSYPVLGAIPEIYVSYDESAYDDENDK